MLLKIRRLFVLARTKARSVVRVLQPQPTPVEPRVSEWPVGTSRCEGSPPSAWEPEQDGDG